MAATCRSDLPSHIKTILVTGAGGFVGQQLARLLLDTYPHVKIIATDIVSPPILDNDQSRYKSVKADLGDVKQVEGLFEGEEIGGVFALHGIMSGGCETNFELGYAVNVDSHLNLLKVTRGKTEGKPKPVYVFVSSLAVYGGPKCTPESYVVPKDTPVLAQSSYGVEKQIMELYVYDYGRKGYLDTRTVRLPTVAVRPGAPSSAASSFISGLIREPLQGLISDCPIATGLDDSNLDTIPFYVSRTKTVISNIAYAICMPESEFKKGESRSINLPGIRVTPRQIIDALVEHGGEEKLKLITYKPDQLVIGICKSWAGDYDSSEAQEMGFEVDDAKTGFGSAVSDFKELLRVEGKLA